MSISIAQAGRLKTEKTKLTTTAQTTVYTATDRARPVIVGIRITNTTGNPVTAIAVLHDAAAALDFNLTGTVPIAANETLEIANLPLALLDGDMLAVTAGTGSALHVAVTALEGIGR